MLTLWIIYSLVTSILVISSLLLPLSVAAVNMTMVIVIAFIMATTLFNPELTECTKTLTTRHAQINVVLGVLSLGVLLLVIRCFYAELNRTDLVLVSFMGMMHIANGIYIMIVQDRIEKKITI